MNLGDNGHLGSDFGCCFCGENILLESLSFLYVILLFVTVNQLFYMVDTLI
jgi:hypothetical protein